MAKRKKTHKRSGAPRRPIKALLTSVGSTAGGIISDVWKWGEGAIRSVMPGGMNHQIAMRKLFKK
jgi:hypothetical protein